MKYHNYTVANTEALDAPYLNNVDLTIRDTHTITKSGGQEHHHDDPHNYKIPPDLEKFRQSAELLSYYSSSATS